MKNPRCEPRPILIVATAVAMVVLTLAFVIVAPAVVVVLVGGIPEPMPSRLPSVATGHLVQSENEGATR